MEAISFLLTVSQLAAIQRVGMLLNSESLILLLWLEIDSYGRGHKKLNIS